MVDCRLTKASYCLLRERVRDTGHDLYPPYYKVQSTKKTCYLNEEEIIVSETKAGMPLQAVLDLTVKRLGEVQHPVIKQLIESGTLDFTLFSKWDCDGRGDHSKYKQIFKVTKKTMNIYS